MKQRSWISVASISSVATRQTCNDVWSMYLHTYYVPCRSIVNYCECSFTLPHHMVSESQKQQLRGAAWEWGYAGFTKGCKSMLIDCKLYMWVWLICQKGVGLSNYSIALASKRRSFETTGKIWVEYISSRTSISAGEQDNLSGKLPSFCRSCHAHLTQH